MTNIKCYSTTKIYPCIPNELKITRQHEDEEYDFIAGDLDSGIGWFG